MRDEREDEDREHGGREPRILPIERAASQDHAHELCAQDDDQGERWQRPKDDVPKRGRDVNTELRQLAGRVQL